MGKGVRRRSKRGGGFSLHIGAFSSYVLYTYALISLDILKCDINVNIETDC